MSHYINPGTITLAIFGIAALIASVKYGGPLIMKAVTAIGNHKRAVFAVLPILGCNGTAFIGQLFFFHDHAKSWPEIGVIMLSGTMESIALFLSSEASEREKLGDSAFGIRMASYMFGAFVGLINYSHYCGPNFRPTVLAVIFGAMSALSPWLWSIYGRGQSRQILLERGVIESRAVKFSKIRWIMWPRETFAALRLAAWTGERNPDKAIQDYEKAQENKRIAREAREALERAERERREREERETLTLETATSQADAIRIAFDELGDDVSPIQVVEYLAKAEPRAWNVSAARVRQVKSARARAASAQEPITLRAIGNELQMSGVSSAFTPRAGRVLRHTGPLRGAHSCAGHAHEPLPLTARKTGPRVRCGIRKTVSDLRFLRMPVNRVSASPPSNRNALTCANALPQTAYTQVTRYPGDFALPARGHAMSPDAMTSVNTERNGAHS